MRKPLSPAIKPNFRHVLRFHPLQVKINCPQLWSLSTIYSLFLLFRSGNIPNFGYLSNIKSATWIQETAIRDLRRVPSCASKKIFSPPPGSLKLFKFQDVVRNGWRFLLFLSRILFNSCWTEAGRMWAVVRPMLHPPALCDYRLSKQRENRRPGVILQWDLNYKWDYCNTKPTDAFWRLLVIRST